MRGEPKLVCRSCGKDDSIRAWYPVDEGQYIVISGLNDDGTVAYDYNGDTESGEAGADESYWCRNCDDSAESLEELLGLPRPASWLMPDGDALTRINIILSDPEWGMGMLEDICAIVRKTGREEVKGAVWDRH